MSIADWPENERPREKLLERGAGALSDAELLAIVLRCGRRGASAVDVARETLQNLGSVRSLLSADQSSFCKHRGLTPTRYAQLHAALELTRRHHQEALRKGPRLNHAQATYDFLLAHLRDREREVFSCLYLDSRHQLIACEDLFHGTIDETRVHPREVVRRALGRNAAAVIVAHNHPLTDKRLNFQGYLTYAVMSYPHPYPQSAAVEPEAARLPVDFYVIEPYSRCGARRERVLAAGVLTREQAVELLGDLRDNHPNADLVTVVLGESACSDLPPPRSISYAEAYAARRWAGS